MDYPEEENTWKPVLVVQQLRKLISLFHKDYLEKPTATFSQINSTPAMARPIVKLTAKSTIKQKQSRPANSATNKPKKIELFPYSLTWLFPGQLIYSLFVQVYWETLVFLFKLSY